MNRPNKLFHIVLIGLLMSLLTVSNDLVLPAFPALREGLFMTTHEVELTLSALLLGFGCSQLFWGIVADQHGRRIVLLSGLGVYTLASLQCAVTLHINALFIARIFQGIGMGAAVVSGRAMVRDVFTPEEAPRAFARSLSILGLFSALSPAMGSLLLHWFPRHTWHVPYMALFVFGWLCWALVAWGFKETLPATPRPALSAEQVLKSVGHILKNSSFQRLILALSVGFAILFTYLASSPFIFMSHFGLSNRVYGALMALTGMAYLAATLCSHALLKRCPVHVTMGLGVSLSVLTSLSMLCITLGWLGEPTWPMMLFCYMGITFSHGIHQPCAQASLVAPFPESAGTAAALGGAMLSIAAYIAGVLLSAYLDQTLVHLALLFCSWSALLAIPVWLYWYLRYRKDKLYALTLVA